MLVGIIFLLIIGALVRGLFFRPWGMYHRPWFGGMWMDRRPPMGPGMGGMHHGPDDRFGGPHQGGFGGPHHGGPGRF